MDADREFAAVACALREAIVEYYRGRGETLDHEAGRRTLDTNTTLAARRARLILDLLERSRGSSDVTGLRVLDLGCGFGALSLYLATVGAEVVGIDPKAERLAVSERLAERFCLPATFRRAWLDELPLPDASADIAVLNNAFCYIVARDERRRGLASTRRVLVPGGWIVLRNPSRSAATDPFTGLPFIHQLPPSVAATLTRRRSPARSRVRLRTARGARMELRRAGFVDAHVIRLDQPRWLPPRYQHLTARRPDDAVD